MSARARHGPRGVGFTLLEVVVVILVIAVLLVLALPPLLGVRADSRRAQSRANLKQLSVVLMLYAGDYKGLFPATYEGEWYPLGEDVLISFPYWQVFFTWPAPVYDYLPIDLHWQTYISPGSTGRDLPGAFVGTSYRYSTSFVGPSRLWSGDDPHAHTFDAQVPQRISAVVFPSNKAMLWDGEPGFDGRPVPRVDGDLAVPTPMAMADGAVTDHAPAEASRPVPNPIQNPVQNRRLHNTRSGVAGLDYPNR